MAPKSLEQNYELFRTSNYTCAESETTFIMSAQRTTSIHHSHLEHGKKMVNCKRLVGGSRKCPLELSELQADNENVWVTLVLAEDK